MFWYTILYMSEKLQQNTEGEKLPTVNYQTTVEGTDVRVVIEATDIGNDQLEVTVDQEYNASNGEPMSVPGEKMLMTREEYTAMLRDAGVAGDEARENLEASAELPDVASGTGFVGETPVNFEFAHTVNPDGSIEQKITAYFERDGQEMTEEISSLIMSQEEALSNLALAKNGEFRAR